MAHETLTKAIEENKEYYLNKYGSDLRYEGFTMDEIEDQEASWLASVLIEMGLI